MCTGSWGGHATTNSPLTQRDEALQRRHAAVGYFLGDGMTPNGSGLAGHGSKTLHRRFFERHGLCSGWTGGFPFAAVWPR